MPAAPQILPILPGGSIIPGKGGSISLFNWLTSGVGTTGVSASPVNVVTIDVAWWKLHIMRNNPVLTYSGQSGARRRRTVSLDFTVQAKVWYDFANPPDIALTGGDGIGVQVSIAGPVVWFGNDVETGVLDQGDFRPYYIAPLCVWSDQNVWDSSEGNQDEDGIVWQDILLEGDSLMTYIPNQNTQDAFQSYVNQLAGQGELPNNL